MTGMHSWVYEVNGHRLSLEGEFLIMKEDVGQKFTYHFYDVWRTTRWEPPHENEQISQSDRFPIRSNIMEGIAFMGGRAIFD